MAIDFSKFDKNVDIEGLKEDVKEAQQNGGNGDYKEVPTGTYEVRIDKLELTESKKGNPMLSVWFKVLEGEFKNSLIFMNQVVTEGFQIAIANRFLESLESGVDVEFDGYNNYASVIMDIAEAIDKKFEYVLDYGENNKGFKTFKITDVFEVE